MKAYMGAVIETCKDYFPKLMRNHRIKVGVIVVLHPFGKDMRFQPHLHLIVTEGGFDQSGRFVNQWFFPARGFAKCWQYHVLMNLRDAGLPPDLVDLMFKRYDGFYVWVHKRGRIHNPGLIARYVGRYVRHPAIANSRITFFDGKTVRFFYINNEDQRIDVTMSAEDFITALIQHIPPSNFKMIRYYGTYARRAKGKYGAKAQSSIEQLNLTHFGFEKTKTCPKCHHTLEFVMYCKKPPPPNKEKLEHWIDLASQN
jgi:hypothetical protein